MIAAAARAKRATEVEEIDGDRKSQCKPPSERVDVHKGAVF